MTDKNYETDDGLTDEEREALKDEDTISAQAAEGADDDNEKAGADIDADEEREAEAAAAAAVAEDKQAKSDAAADANAKELEAAGSEPAEASTQQAPILVAPDVQDAEAKLTEIASQKDKLLEQFDDGDITAREFQKQMDDLNKQERKIEFDVREAELAAKLETQRVQNEWASTVNSFIDANPIYKENTRLYRALDQEVKDLAAKPETANWSGSKFLAEAHKNLAEAFGLSKANAPTSPKTPKRPTDDLPPNLAKVPAADVQDMDGGQFAVLDRLAATDPIGYEEALAKMPQAARDAYVAAG